ncbi:MAG: PrsW family intramembrane metalloprotease [Patescibacteria group bacterium]|mgnify:FL=1
MDYKIILYIFFGILPALVWLSYYLRKDVHPEPKLMVLKVFLWGAFITLPVFLAQLGLSALLAELNLPTFVVSLLYWFVVIALTEEFFKYLVVRGKVFNDCNLDEPLDIMLYMIISALGFAALENILYLFSPANNLSFNQVLNNTIIISFVRFIGATFLHTLASGTLGYFLALSFYETKNKTRLFLAGLSVAAIAHGLYNFSIMTFKGILQLSIPIIILTGLAIFMIWAFNRVKSMKSVGKI